MKVHQWWVIEGWVGDDSMAIDGHIVSIHGSLREAMDKRGDDFHLRTIQVAVDIYSGEVERVLS